MQPEIITESEDYLVINKPANMATEPPSREKTLRDWLIETGKINAGEWEEKQRCGIVHRLDTDTSGVIIWAKNSRAQEDLKTKWQGRQTEKIYLALVSGITPTSGVIELELARDNKKDRQTVVWIPNDRSRPAITRYTRLAVGKIGVDEVSLVEAHPVTGRTHQIRVHLKALGHPIIGDELYGEKLSSEIAKRLNLTRQFLHAVVLLVPGSPTATPDKAYQSYFAPLPPELETALSAIGIDPRAIDKNFSHFRKPN